MRFGWQTRLTRSSDINRVLQHGKRLNCGVFLLFALPREKVDETVPTRLCPVVSKRVSKRAVDRNRVKRRLRSLYRDCQTDLPPLTDLVVVARSGVMNATYEELTQRLKKACAHYKRE
jgi:ribonuclease P protein component